jgi:hypothetical protein
MCSFFQEPTNCAKLWLFFTLLLLKNKVNFRAAVRECSAPQNSRARLCPGRRNQNQGAGCLVRGQQERHPRRHRRQFQGRPAGRRVQVNANKALTNLVVFWVPLATRLAVNFAFLTGFCTPISPVVAIAGLFVQALDAQKEKKKKRGGKTQDSFQRP